ncbi:hypothetical protein SKAU_G00279660 [Synaphobranchus kaupii]|uniref:Reverse transcriptase RNase H-like domain-containing protein n=1 Tax=Synaphobranchus kaupii TaxID=118154 RepID=A0A9Q1EWW3_SYNKA|nr:hypothetical protein SKAU_G00279660 [Synaphobranchus kaupii]
MPSTPQPKSQLLSVPTPRPGKLKRPWGSQNSQEGAVSMPIAAPATPVCTASPMAAVQESCEGLPSSTRGRLAALREIWQRSAGDLEVQQQEQLWQLPLEFQDCFSCEEEELGQTSLVQHSIDTGNAAPIRQRPRRLPLARQEAAEQALAKMQRAGIIEPLGITRDCETAFHALQQALTSAPILAPPDPQLPFVLDTDASGEGVGAVLSQGWPEGEKVVAYYSKALSKAERRYCVTRRELLAVVFAIRHFKYYLCGRPFTVRTDHASLQWLMSFKEPEGQLARWLEELQCYEFTVTHRAGERHGNADALSRRPCSAEGCRYCDRREAREQELGLGADK